MVRVSEDCLVADAVERNQSGDLLLGNNREFLRDLGPKQASDGFISQGPWKFNHDSRQLAAIPGLSYYCAEQAFEAQEQAIPRYAAP